MTTAALQRILNNQILVIHCVGDSTVDNLATSWPHMLGQRLAAAHPTAKVQFFDYWPNNPLRSPVAPALIQSGSGTGADIRIIRDGVPGNCVNDVVSRASGMFSTVHLAIFCVGIVDAGLSTPATSYVNCVLWLSNKAKSTTPGCEVLHIPPVWGDYPFGVVQPGFSHPAIYNELTRKAALVAGDMVADVRGKRYVPHYNGVGTSGQDGWLMDLYHPTPAGHVPYVDEIMNTVFS